jgi:hypothetical protein
MRKTVEARVISSKGPGKEAQLEIDGKRYTVCDGFGWSMESAPTIGEVFDAELSSILDEDETWEEKFAGNPQCIIGLKSTGGWSYLALGQITSIAPVSINCGILVESRAIYTTDARVIGEYVAFRINCLEACGHRRSN